MKGISKYVNDYVKERTCGCYGIALTAKLHVNNYNIRNNIIRFNKNVMYRNILNKDIIDRIIEEAIIEIKLLDKNTIIKKLGDKRK